VGNTSAPLKHLHNLQKFWKFNYILIRQKSQNTGCSSVQLMHL